MGVGWVSAEGEVSTVSPDSVAQLYQWDPLAQPCSMPLIPTLLTVAGVPVRLCVSGLFTADGIMEG